MILTVLGVILFYVIPGLLLLEIARCIYLEFRRDRVPILLYHRIVSKAAVDHGEVPDSEMIWVCYDTEFEKQMAYLRDAGYTTLSMDDYVAIRAGQAPLPPKPVIVTIDDGYASAYEMAYPAIRRNGHKATVYVAPEPDEHTRNLVAGVDGFLSEEQMRELVAGNVAIESHTLTHCKLSELDNEQALHELTEVRRRLNRITDRPIEHIAIPRSGYSRRIKRLVRQAGYKTACCNNKGSATGMTDLLALPRIVIERDMSVDEFARSLTPKTAVMLRIVGNVKRIPERLGGPTFARRVRDMLYGSPLGPLFRTRNLKRIVGVLALLYVVGSVLFTWNLLRS